MINLLFPIFDKLDSWISHIMSFPIQNLSWGILAGIFAFIVYWLLSNQESISNIKNEMKLIRKQMFELSLEEKAEYNALAKKNLSLSFNYLAKIFIPAIISIIPVVIIILWYDMNYSYDIPYENENIAVTTIPDNLIVTFKPNDIISIDVDGNITLKSFNTSDRISIYSDSNLIYSGNLFNKPIPYLTKRKWWSFILNSPTGYILSEAPIDVIMLRYPKKVLFPKMPDILSGWELLFFVGIFISTLPLRFIFKVQ